MLVREIAEAKRRQKLIRDIHRGIQPKKEPHHSYYRLNLIKTVRGVHTLTQNAIEHFILSDHVAGLEKIRDNYEMSGWDLSKPHPSVRGKTIDEIEAMMDALPD